jgi:ATP-dependent DNA helicase RecQ
MASGRLKLLYVAPERLLKETFVERLKGVHIAMMAVDEAHCISEWGHSFRPEYLRLAHVAREMGIKRVLALTATATVPSSFASHLRRNLLGHPTWTCPRRPSTPARPPPPRPSGR